MQIVTTTDSINLSAAATLHASLKHNGVLKKHDFAVIYFGESNDVYTYFKRYKVKVIVNPTFPFNVEELVAKSRRNPTGHKATWSKILLSELFPKSRRILSLDTDTVVIKNVDDLETLDLKGFPLGGCKTIGFNSLSNLCPRGKFTQKELDVQMINAGVLLINTSVWREKFFNQMVENVASYSKYFWYKREQTLINFTARDQRIILPQKWNTMVHRNPMQSDTVIVHWAGPKPWNINRESKFPDLWKFYRRMVKL